jgi:hypothetical protein
MLERVAVISFILTFVAAGLLLIAVFSFPDAYSHGFQDSNYVWFELAYLIPIVLTSLMLMRVGRARTKVGTVLNAIAACINTAVIALLGVGLVDAISAAGVL